MYLCKVHNIIILVSYVPQGAIFESHNFANKPKTMSVIFYRTLSMHRLSTHSYLQCNVGFFPGWIGKSCYC